MFEPPRVGLAVGIGEDEQIASRQGRASVARLVRQEPHGMLFKSHLGIPAADEGFGLTLGRGVDHDHFEGAAGLPAQGIEAVWDRARGVIGWNDDRNDRAMWRVHPAILSDSSSSQTRLSAGPFP